MFGWSFIAYNIPTNVEFSIRSDFAWKELRTHFFWPSWSLDTSLTPEIELYTPTKHCLLPASTEICNAV